MRGRAGAGCSHRAVWMTTLVGHPLSKLPSADHQLQGRLQRCYGGAGRVWGSWKAGHSPGGVLPTAGRSKPQGWARGCTGPAATGAAAQEPGGPWSQALQRSRGSASAAAVAGKAAVVGPRGNAPQQSPGPQQASGGGEGGTHAGGEEPNLKSVATTKNHRGHAEQSRNAPGCWHGGNYQEGAGVPGPGTLTA